VTRHTVLLTGATGFFGSHLLRGLLADGHSVVVLKRSTSDIRRIAAELPRVVAHDVDRVSLETVFEASPIDLVVHAATAYGRDGASASDVARANVLFPLQLLEIAIQCRVIAFINADSFSTRTSQLPEGLDRYALTKRHFREIASLVASAAQFRLVSMYIEHMYGPDDVPAKFIPTVIAALLSRKPELALTPGAQRRDFVYVDDVVAAFRTVIDHVTAIPAAPAAFDVGTGVSVDVRHVVTRLRDLSGAGTRLDFGALPYRKDELMDSHADCAPLARLGWTARTALDDGLARTIAAART
jgi:CDP-paratose synthetase